MTASQLNIKIVSEGAQRAVADVRSVGDAVETTGRQSQTGMSGITKAALGMGAVGGILTASLTRPILDLGLNIVGMASDSNEALNAVTNVFGTAAAGVIQHSQGAAAAVGLSQSQYLSATTQLAAYGKMMGLTQGQTATFADQTVSAAADLASFYNTSPEDAMSAINAGFRGEGDALERYGIIMNQATVEQYALTSGIWDGNGAMTNAQLVQARSGYIMSQLTDETGSANAAMGDFTETSGGLANQQRILTATAKDVGAQFGQVLLPIALKLVGGFAKVLGVLADLSPTAKTAVVVIGAIAAAAGPLLVVFGSLLGAVGAVTAAFGTGGLLAGLTPLLGPIGLIVAALIGLGIAYKTNFLGFGDAVRAVGSLVKDGFNGIKDAVLGVLDPIIQPFKTLKKVFDDLTKPVNDATATLTRLGLPITAVSTKVNRFTAFVTALRTAFPALNGPIDAVSSIVKTLGKVFDDIVDTVRNVVSQFQTFRNAGMSPVSSAVAALSNVFTSFKDTFAAVGTAVNAGIAIFTNLKDAVTAALGGDWSSAWESLKAAFGSLGDFIKASVTAWATLLVDVWNAIDWGAVGSALLAGAGIALDYLIGLTRDVWGFIKTAADTIPWSTIGEALLTGAGVAVDYIADVSKDIWGWIATKVGEIDWSSIGTTIHDGIVDALNGMASFSQDLLNRGAELLGGLLQGAVEYFPTITGWVVTIGGLLAAAIKDAASWLLGKGREAMSGLLAGAVAYWPTVLGWVATIGTLLVGAIVGAADWLRSKGTDVMSGLLAGAVAYWPTVTGWLGTVGSLVLGVIGDAATWLLAKGQDAIVGLLNGIISYWPTVTGWLATVRGLIVGAVGDLVATLMGKGQDLIVGLLNGAIAFWPTITGWVGTIGSLIVGAIGDLVGTLASKGQDVIVGLLNGAIGYWPIVTGWVGTIGGLVVGAVGDLASTLVTKGSDLIVGFLNGLIERWPTVFNWIGTIGSLALTALGNLVDKLVPGGSDLIAGLWSGATAKWSEVWTWITGIPQAAFDALSGIGTKLWDAGTALIDGLWQGAKAKWTEFTDWITGLSPADFIPAGFSLDPRDWFGGNDKQQDIDTTGTAPVQGPVFTDNGAAAALELAIAASSEAIRASLQQIINDAIFMKESLVSQFADAGLTIGGGVTAFVADVPERLRLGFQQIMGDTTAMRNQMVADFNQAGLDIGAGVTLFVADVPTRLRAGFQQIMIDSTNVKIGLVTDFNDMVATTMGVAGAWQAGIVAIASALSASVRASISTMKIGVVSDTNDTVSTTLGVFGGWQTGMIGIASRLDASVRGSISTMKSGIVSDVRDAVNTSIAEFGRIGTEGAGKIDSGAGTVGTAAYNMGALASLGVANGIDAYLYRVTNAVNSIVNEVDRALRAGLRVASPSKLTAYYGAMTTEGLATGMTNAIGSVTSATARLVGTISTGLSSLGGVRDIVAGIDAYAGAGTPQAGRFNFYENLGGDPWRGNNGTATNLTDTMKIVADSLASVLRDGEWSSDVLGHLPTQAIRDMTLSIGKALAPYEGQANVFESVFSALKNLISTGSDGGTFANVFDPVEANLTKLADMLRGQFDVQPMTDVLGSMQSISAGIDAFGRGQWFRDIYKTGQPGDTGGESMVAGNITDTMKIIADSLMANAEGGEWGSDVNGYLPTNAIHDLMRQIGKALSPFEGNNAVFESTFSALKALVGTGRDGGFFGQVPDAVEAGLTQLAAALRTEFDIRTAVPVTPVSSSPSLPPATPSTARPQATYTLNQYNTMTVSVKDAEEMVRLSRFVEGLPQAMSIVFGASGGAY